MRIDRTHRGWFIGSVIATVAAAALYVWQARTDPRGPRGDSWLGLTLGIAAALMILYAGFLGARKKLLLLRIGSVTWWMRGHLWLGTLALPLAVMHGAFSFGGLLTTILMWLLIVVVISGLVGALLQHALPDVMSAQVTTEHTYEQHEQVRWNLRREAYETVTQVCGAVAEAADERSALEARTGHAPKEPKKTTEVEGREAISRFYVQRVVPYLRDGRANGSPLTDGTTASFAFEAVRTTVDPSIHETLDDLASICDEARQLRRQGLLHRWLHGWLLLHVPLSMALMVLLVVHAVMALYY
jgi:hypothetical protein